MEKEIIASDLDGTYDEHPEIHGEVSLIITGNSWENYDSVMNTMYGLPPKPIYFSTIKKGEEDYLNIATFKSSIINKIGVTKFYENSLTQVDMIRLLSPDCKVILVKDNMNFI